MPGSGTKKGMEFKHRESMQNESGKYSIFSRNLLSLFLSSLLSLLAVGCEENRLSQCERIFQIAHRVTANNLELSRLDEVQLAGLDNWLQAAEEMYRAAEAIETLKLDNSKLIQYQHQLATIYRIYSRSTYDAVTARENKNLEALESARNDAVKAGEMQQNLVREINAFCLGR